MHHLRSRYAVALFKVLSWLLFLKWLLIVLAIGGLICAVIAVDKRLADLALGLLLAALLAGLLHWAVSAWARCPLCLNPPIAHRRCAMHRKAQRLLGSYRLRVACSVIFRNYFRCPYCGEATAVATRTVPPPPMTRQQGK